MCSNIGEDIKDRSSFIKSKSSYSFLQILQNEIMAIVDMPMYFTESTQTIDLNQCVEMINGATIYDANTAVIPPSIDNLNTATQSISAEKRMTPASENDEIPWKIMFISVIAVIIVSFTVYIVYRVVLSIF